MAESKKKIVRKRHRFFMILLKILAYPVLKVMFNFHRGKPYKIKNGEPMFIISNHQTDLDPAWVQLCFDKNLYFVCTDTITSSKFYKFVKYTIEMIPKKKGVSDITTTRKMLQIAKEGGSIALFPEGNRSYGEFQFCVEESLVKLIRKLGMPLAIVNISGGYGKSPRFAKKRRKGKLSASIKRIVTKEEYSKMSDTEFHNLIMDEIRVYDSENGESYKSDIRAEYLERELFVCPVCKKAETLTSKGNILHCTSCGLEVEYTEDLKFKSDNPEFKFRKMVEWYDFQKEWVRSYNNDCEKIFSDEYAELYSSKTGIKRTLIDKGPIVLTREFLKIGNQKFQLSDIEIASPVSGRKMALTIDGESYLIKGHERFNPLKYVFMFNKLDTKMKDNQTDIYYSIDERK